MRKGFLLFIFLIASNFVFSQIIVKGKVGNNKGVLADVNVTLSQKGDNHIIAFSFTNERGFFEIKNNITDDSIRLSFSIIGYKTKDLILANKTQQIDCTLAEFVTELPTVIVKQLPIVQNGDTTNYNVSQFTGKQDRVIGDVIAKLPGVEINETTGQISFNGKPISHYYIDGLDLLESRYNIANRNIPADLVDQVQMLAHDKNIKLFDSLKTSNDPAVNIKLKSKARNKFIGKGKAGLGISPLLYDNELTGLMFYKKLQFISSYKNNNAGSVLGNELADNVSVQKVGEQGEKSAKEEILSVVAAPNPSISGKRYLFNNTHLAYINVLKVLPNTSQIKFNLSYLNDNILANNETNTTYFLPTGNVEFTEKIKSFINTNKISGNIFYTLNKRSAYLKNNTEFVLEYINQKSTVQNISLINQVFNNPYFKYKNNFSLFLPIKKTIAGVNSKISFTRMPQQLNVTPGQFTNIFNQSIPYEQLLQTAIADNFNADNNISFSAKKGKALHQIKIGAEYIFKNLKSQTDKSFNQIIYNLNDSFRNDTQWFNLRWYAENIISFAKGERTLDITLPTELNILSTSNKFDTSINKRTCIFFNPSIDFNIPVSSKISFGCTYILQHITGSISQITDGFILKNYRTVSNNENNLPLDRQQLFNITAYYKNPLNAVFANFSFSISDTKKNIIYSQLFNNLLITSKVVFLPNRSQNTMFSTSISKFFIEPKINLSLNLSTNYATTDILQQTKLFKNDNQFYNGIFKISFSKLTWLSLESNSKIDIFRNRIKEINATYNTTMNFTQTIKSYFFVTPKTILSFNTEFYNFGDRNKKQPNYFFADLTATKKFKNTDIELLWSNITANKSFISTNINNNFKQLNFYTIRPANILVKFSFRF